jgi:hypothetical protein
LIWAYDTALPVELLAVKCSVDPLAEVLMTVLVSVKNASAVPEFGKPATI